MHTLRLPDALDGMQIRSYLKAEGAAVRAGEPIAMMMRLRRDGSTDGAPQRLVADTDGVLHRLLVVEAKRCVAGMPMALLGMPAESAGFEPAAVSSVRLALLRRCSECGAEYPLNGLVERARCIRCGDVQISSPAFWTDPVGLAVNEGERPRHLVERALRDEYGQTSIQAWGIPPLCRACHALLDWGAVSESVDRARQGPVSVACVQCGEAHRVRLPAKWAYDVFPRLVLLLGETAAESSEAPVQPVVFKCPSCLAALKIDGAKRIVCCEYCRSEVYLPDDLWMHFNPASRRGRWWMLLRP